MQPDEVLMMMAQLGVAIAGFNGVAHAVSRHERPSARRWVMGSTLITASAAVIGWSVFPLVLLTTAMPAVAVWRISSLGWALTQVGLLVFRQRQAQRMGLASDWLVNALRLLALFTTTLQVGNAFAWGLAWPHVVAVTTNLVIAIAAFFLLFHEDGSET